MFDSDVALQTFFLFCFKFAFRFVTMMVGAPFALPLGAHSLNIPPAQRVSNGGVEVNFSDVAVAVRDSFKSLVTVLTTWPRSGVFINLMNLQLFQSFVKPSTRTDKWLFSMKFLVLIQLIDPWG